MELILYSTQTTNIMQLALSLENMTREYMYDCVCNGHIQFDVRVEQQQKIDIFDHFQGSRVDF